MPEEKFEQICVKFDIMISIAEAEAEVPKGVNITMNDFKDFL